MAKVHTMRRFSDGKYTLTVCVSRLLTWRVRVGVLLIRLGAWVVSVGYREERSDV